MRPANCKGDGDGLHVTWSRQGGRRAQDLFGVLSCLLSACLHMHVPSLWLRTQPDRWRK